MGPISNLRNFPKKARTEAQLRFAICQRVNLLPNDPPPVKALAQKISTEHEDRPNELTADCPDCPNGDFFFFVSGLQRNSIILIKREKEEGYLDHR